jgi:hypothetical protein
LLPGCAADAGSRAAAPQAAELDGALAGTGGLSSYIARARQLLEDSKNDKNPFEGFTPSVPEARACSAQRAARSRTPRLPAPWTPCAAHAG